MWKSLLVATAVSSAACTTTFHGSSRVPNGRAGCEQVCAQWKMELAGMIQMGDYSDGCVCQVPGNRVSPAAAASAAEAGVAAVETKRQEEERMATQPPPATRPPRSR